MRGVLYMVVVITFIFVSQFIFKGNPSGNNEDCARYGYLANDC
jgi:hypothetical protein